MTRAVEKVLVGCYTQAMTWIQAIKNWVFPSTIAPSHEIIRCKETNGKLCTVTTTLTEIVVTCQDGQVKRFPLNRNGDVSLVANLNGLYLNGHKLEF